MSASKSIEAGSLRAAQQRNLMERTKMKKHQLEPMAQFFNSRADIYDEVHTSHIDGGRESKDIREA